MTSDGQRELPFSHSSYYLTNEPINHQTVPLPNYPRFSSLQYWNGHPNVITNTLPSAADTATPYYPSSHVTPQETSAAGYPYGPNTVNPSSSAQSLSISNTFPPVHEPGYDVGSTIQSMYLPEYNLLSLLADIGPVSWAGPEAFEQEFHQELTATRNVVATAPSSSTPTLTTALSNTLAVEPSCLRPPVEEFRTNGGEISTHNQVDKYPTPTSSAVTRKRKQASGPSKVAGRPLKRRNGAGNRATPDVQKETLMNNATSANRSLLRQSRSSHVTTPPTTAEAQRLELTEDNYDTRQMIRGEFFQGASNFVVKDPKMTINHVYKPDGLPNDPALLWLKRYAMEGAEYDSGDRDPPPRCHPGTRTTITQNIQGWLENSERKKNLLWLRGTAGAGKSAIVQTVAESLSGTGRLGASLFFSRPNGRSNPRQILPTLAYQFAVQDPSYREYITQFVLTNPGSLDKAMNEQFRILIVEPFVRKGIRGGKAAWVVTLDGLDECGEDPNGRRHSNEVQRDVVHLISDFVRQYPTAPLIWIIASRPEVHLKAAFSKPDVVSTCWEEEVPVDSDEACEDVEKFLHTKFTEIGEDYPEHIFDSPWPTHKQFLKIAHAALGLFIFAEVVVRFVGDPEVGNPIAQLECLLFAISKMRSRNQRNPLANLDMIYLAILSKIPLSTLPITKRLLGFLILLNKKSVKVSECNLCNLCDILEISKDTGITTLRHLHSVLYFPKVQVLGHTRPRFYHASFRDFLEDKSRSHEYFVDKQEFTKDLFLQDLIRVAQAQFSSDPDSPLSPLPGENEPGRYTSEFVIHVFRGNFSSNGVRFGGDSPWLSPLADAQLQPLLESLNVLKVLKYAPSVLDRYFPEENEREPSRRGFLSCTTLGSLGIDWGTVSMSISTLGDCQHVQVDTTLGIQTEPHGDSPDVQEFRCLSKAAVSNTKVRVWGHRKSGCRVAVVYLGWHHYALTGIPLVTT